MSEKKTRKYSSASRQRQSDETRTRIADAAQHLLETVGFAAMTVEAIAEAAGVATQTVYANFGSKSGIMLELLERARFGPQYEESIRRVFQTSDPRARLRLVAGIPRQIYECEHATLRLVTAGGALSPALAAAQKEQECRRYEMQAVMIQFLVDEGVLKPGLDTTTARDLLWLYTARDIFRLLVLERGWTADQYEKWIGERLVEELIGG